MDQPTHAAPTIDADESDKDDGSQKLDAAPTAATALAALGIVYGDLGTSPLYTYQTIVSTVGGHPDATAAIGLLSLVVWSLIIVVSIKYCVFVMRADNHGEGGILALMSLVVERIRDTASPYIYWSLTLLGLFGAALLYGDGAITPAISVLSAVEGINVATSVFKPYVLPIALVILFVLFVAQRSGTSAIGRVFGPVMLLWFVTIGVLGLFAAIHEPRVLAALNPLAALGALVHNGWHSFIVLGGVFLALTGGEALYADIGSVGRKPIRAGWYTIVLPALLLCYAGQTALLIGDAKLEGNPFFHLAPHWAVVPLVILATLATIIASQAIITGVFSMTRQAMQLGWFPGMYVRQTSDREYGQIYVGVVNWIMMACTLLIAAGFGSSDRLAGAYGTAVSTTMLMTTMLLFNAMRDVWRWNAALAGAVCGGLFLVDLGFFAANLLKLFAGGWVPLLIAAAILTIMLTWHHGIVAVGRALAARSESRAEFLARLRDGSVARVPGTAVFLSRRLDEIPPLLTEHAKQMKALPETVIGLTVRFRPVPRVAAADRVTVEEFSDGLWHIGVEFGFVEIPSIPRALDEAQAKGCPLEGEDVVYFASDDEVREAERGPKLPAWQRQLFAFMYRNAIRPPDRFELPPDKFLEIGRQLTL